MKFSAGVIHVGNIHSRDEIEGSLIMCCLSSGRIAAFCITKIVKLYVIYAYCNRINFCHGFVNSHVHCICHENLIGYKGLPKKSYSTCKEILKY